MCVCVRVCVRAVFVYVCVCCMFMYLFVRLFCVVAGLVFRLCGVVCFIAAEWYGICLKCRSWSAVCTGHAESRSNKKYCHLSKVGFGPHSPFSSSWLG